MNLRHWLAVLALAGCGPSFNLGDPVDGGVDSAPDMRADLAPDVGADATTAQPELPSEELVLEEPHQDIERAFALDIVFSERAGVYVVAYVDAFEARFIRLSTSGELLQGSVRLGDANTFGALELVETSAGVVAAWGAPSGIVAAAIDPLTGAAGPVASVIAGVSTTSRSNVHSLSLLAEGPNVHVGYADTAEAGEARYSLTRLSVEDGELGASETERILFDASAGRSPAMTIIAGVDSPIALVVAPESGELSAWNGSELSPIELDLGSRVGDLRAASYAGSTWLVWSQREGASIELWGAHFNGQIPDGAPRRLMLQGGVSLDLHYGADGLVVVPDESEAGTDQAIHYARLSGDEIALHTFATSAPRQVGYGGAIAAAFDRAGNFLLALQSRSSRTGILPTYDFELAFGELGEPSGSAPSSVPRIVSATNGNAVVSACWDDGCDVAWTYSDGDPSGPWRARLDATGPLQESTSFAVRATCAARSGERTLIGGEGLGARFHGALVGEGHEALVEWSLPHSDRRAIHCASDRNGFLVASANSGFRTFQILAYRTGLDGAPQDEPLTIFERATGEAELASLSASDSAHLFLISEWLADEAVRSFSVLTLGHETADVRTAAAGLRFARYPFVSGAREGRFALVGEDPDQPARPEVRWIDATGEVSPPTPLFPGRGRAEVLGLASTDAGVVALMRRDDGSTPEFDPERASLIVAAVEAPYAEVDLGPLDLGQVIALHQTGEALRVVYRRSQGRVSTSLISTRLLPMPRRTPE